MAVKFIQTYQDGLVGLWEITESTEELLGQLNPLNQEMEQYLLFKNETRKKEWLSVRLLLQQMKGNNARIFYTQNGKPELLNTPGNISISHSSGFVAIFFHPELHPGIDIELITRNVERASGKFLSIEELQDCTFNTKLSNKDLMLRWCAKEAVFKMVPYTDIDFASQISCKALPLTTTEGTLTATFSNTTTNFFIPLHYKLTGDLMMVLGAIKI